MGETGKRVNSLRQHGRLEAQRSLPIIEHLKMINSKINILSTTAPQKIKGNILSIARTMKNPEKSSSTVKETVAVNYTR